MTFGDDFISLIVSFLVALAGTTVGVYAAFRLDNYRDSQSEKKARKRVLSLLHYELRKNLEIINLIKQVISAVKIVGDYVDFPVPYEHPSFSIYEGISNKFELLADTVSFVGVDAAYHNFLVLDDAVKRYENRAVVALVQPNLEIQKQLVKQVIEQRDAIIEHLTPSEKGNDIFTITKSAISALDREMNILDRRFWF